METIYERTELLIGTEAVERLRKSRVAVFGVGGVGGFTVEALARAGVGELDLIDKDTISISNINRQLIATTANIGKLKVEEMKERIAQINPEIKVNAYPCFFLPETAEQFDFAQYDYVVDAVDTVTAKIELALCCQKAGIAIIAAMGAGNKLDPTRFEVADIYKTSVCPLAKVMRRELKKRGIEKLKVVYSKEEPRKPLVSEEKTGKSQTPGREPRVRQSPGSISFVPSAAGLIIAAEVIKDIAM